MNVDVQTLTLNAWSSLRAEAQKVAEEEPDLAPFLERCLLSHSCFGSALCCVLSSELSAELMPRNAIYRTFSEAMADDLDIEVAAIADLQAHVDRDPASCGYLTPFLYFKGFHALQAHRMSHWLWNNGRKSISLFFQGRASRVYDVDIHPAARLGRGIMIDHGSGLVIGETAVVEDDVSMLHGVTLGGTGKDTGDRHPKIRRGVLLSAGARILGNIEIGEGAKVGAASLVLESVPAHTTYAGVPAKQVGKPRSPTPALEMDHDVER